MRRNRRKLLDASIVFAVNAHAGQSDRGGHPYILHCLHVMQQQTCLEAMIVGVLHDVLEDTKALPADLVALGLSKMIVDDIRLLTRRRGVSPWDHAYRIKHALTSIPLQVKLADLRHNQDITRLIDPTDADRARIKMYHEIEKYLTSPTEALLPKPLPA